MDAIEKTTAALNGLIIINNDRYEGYKTAAEETTDGDLKALFTRLSTQSKGYSSELQMHVPFADDAPDRDETTLSGKFYRIWMDIRAALTAKDRKNILASCEFGEDVAQKAYDTVLKDPGSISPALIALIRKQKDELDIQHNHIKTLRDNA
jgi:uncharacterized protein (TIGR02284 family)